MRNARRLTRGLAASAAAVLLLTAPSVAFAKDTVAFTISDKEIAESSGLARDTAGNVYWTVNDSGAEGVIYCLDTTGETGGRLMYGAEPQDVEAVAMADNRLYVGDIGDNDAERDFVSVLYFDNPEVAVDRSRQYRAYDFTYPDGPRDAETLLVDGNGRLYIVSKEDDAGIYAAPVNPSRSGTNMLERVGDAPAYVTDGVFLPDSDKIALRTYVSVEMLDAESYKVVGRAATPFQPQGESIAVSLEGDKLLVGSEGKKSKVYEMAIPTDVDDAPDAKASPPESEDPTPTPKADKTTTAGDDPGQAAEDPETEPVGQSRLGTMIALGLAGLLALIAGAVVVIRRS